MPNVLVKLALSARSWHGFSIGGTQGSEHSFPLRGPFLLRNSSSAHTIWRRHGKGGLGFFPSTPTPLVEIPEFSLHKGLSFCSLVWGSSTCELPPSQGAPWALGGFLKAGKAKSKGWRICGAALGFSWCAPPHVWLTFFGWEGPCVACLARIITQQGAPMGKRGERKAYKEVFPTRPC